MMSPKFRCQAHVRHPSEKVQPTQNTVRQRGYFIREIISPSDEMIAHIHRPFFMNVFLHTSLAWGVTARHCTASTSGEFSNIWQSKRVGIIAIKNKRTRIRFHRYSPGGRGILNSLTWGIDWWRKKKITSGHRTRTFRSLCLKSLRIQGKLTTRERLNPLGVEPAIS